MDPEVVHAQPPQPPPQPQLSEGEQLNEALRGSDATLQLLSTRGSTLASMRALLRKGDLRGALVAGRRASDAVPSADMMASLMARRGFGDMLGLDAVPDLVAVLEAVLTLPAEQHRLVSHTSLVQACIPFRQIAK
jgi:hypothetical protein